MLSCCSLCGGAWQQQGWQQDWTMLAAAAVLRVAMIVLVLQKRSKLLLVLVRQSELCAL
jgi:hypothetical protein